MLPFPLTLRSRDKSESVNAAFEINPDANNGLNYAYDTVVRNKEDRRKMHGSDCECCKEVSFPSLPHNLPLIVRTPVLSHRRPITFPFTSPALAYTSLLAKIQGGHARVTYERR